MNAEKLIICKTLDEYQISRTYKDGKSIRHGTAKIDFPGLVSYLLCKEDKFYLEEFNVEFYNCNKLNSNERGTIRKLINIRSQLAIAKAKTKEAKKALEGIV